MILVDRPYVSDFFKTFVTANRIPVILTEYARSLGFSKSKGGIEPADAVNKITANPNTRIYSTSENAISWINQYMAHTELPKKIAQFKNKAGFRKQLKPLFPDFFYREITLSQMEKLTPEQLSCPFIIKPNTGFFSMGVHPVAVPEDWPKVRSAIFSQLGTIAGQYPESVINTTTFVMEETIEGAEYAMDAYFDESGDPVIWGIFKHVFSSNADVRDRLYITSKSIIAENISRFARFLADMGRLVDVKNFPVHVEVRITAEGTIVPIEVNPMRFGGGCTTADLTWLAFTANPYAGYLENRQPDWPELLKDKSGKIYSIIILDNASGISGKEILSFDYDRLAAQFANPLELRKIDFTAYPLFGFLFTETPEDRYEELENILRSDLKEYIRVP